MVTASEFIRTQTWEVIFNPNAFGNRKEEKWGLIKAQLSQLSVLFSAHHVESSTICQSLLQRLCNDGKRHFLIVGGDGTLNDCLNGIFSSGIPTSEAFLWVVPIGTGNDWSRTHFYPEDFAYELSDFKHANFISHDVGVVKIIGEKNFNRYFLNIAGFCFDGAVIENIARKKNSFNSSLVYLLGVLKVLLSYRPKKTVITSKEQTINDKIFTIAVGIGRYNGNGMKQVPNADPQDGLFDVVVIRKISKLKVIRNIKKLYSGTHTKLKEVTQFRTNELTITSNSPFFGEVEGEVLKQGDYKIENAPDKINILSFNPHFK